MSIEKDVNGHPVAKVETPSVERSWFPDEEGYQGEPIKYGGKEFYPREVTKAGLREFSRDTQRIQRETKILGRQQQDELKAIQRQLNDEYSLEVKTYKEALARGENVEEPEKREAELSEERRTFFEGEGERLVDELNAAYNSLLEKGIVGWNLSRPFTKEALFSFAKVDKVALCEQIGTRSTSGFEAVKN